MPRGWTSEGAAAASGSAADEDEPGQLGSVRSDAQKSAVCRSLYQFNRAPPPFNEIRGALKVRRWRGKRTTGRFGFGLALAWEAGLIPSSSSLTSSPPLACLASEQPELSTRVKSPGLHDGRSGSRTSSAADVLQQRRRRRRRAACACVCLSWQSRRFVGYSARSGLRGIIRAGDLYPKFKRQIWLSEARRLRGFSATFPAWKPFLSCSRGLAERRGGGGGGGEESGGGDLGNSRKDWMGACVARFGPPRMPCLPHLTGSTKALQEKESSKSKTDMSGEQTIPLAGGGGPKSSSSSLSHPKRSAAPTLDLTLISPSLDRSPSTPSSSSSFAGLGSSRLLLHREDSDLSGIESGLSENELTWCQQALQTFEEISNSLRPSHGFDRDFQLLQQETESKEFQAETGGCARGSRLINAKKNRYPDVIPFDNTLVPLMLGRSGAREVEEADAGYINASFLKDDLHRGLPCYIATQGPLQSTSADFWQMVKEQGCKAVIMLTKEIENSRAKCGRYFPLAEGEVHRYGHLIVTTTANVQFHGSIDRRDIEITIAGCSDSPVKVEHYHYLQWPDHGVPSSTRPIRDLIRHLRLSSISEGPFLVHCSAGIGRTGAYCAVDITMRRILQGDLSAIYIRDTVKRLRKQRAGMVQTKEQYFFCFMAVRDELMDLIELENRRRRALDVTHGPPPRDRPV